MIVLSPQTGNNYIGSKLVAGKGNASVNHQVAIKTATPKVLQAIMFNESGVYRKLISINTRPKVNPKYLLFFIIDFIFIENNYV